MHGTVAPWCCLLPADSATMPTADSPQDVLRTILTHLHTSNRLHRLDVGAAVSLAAPNARLFADALVHRVLASCADHYDGEQQQACMPTLPPLPPSCIPHVTTCAQQLCTIYHDAETMGISLQQQAQAVPEQFTHASQHRRASQHPAFSTSASQYGCVAPGPSNVPDTWHGLAGTLGSTGYPKAARQSGRMCTSMPRSRVHGKLDWE